MTTPQKPPMSGGDLFAAACLIVLAIMLALILTGICEAMTQGDTDGPLVFLGWVIVMQLPFLASRRV